MEGVLPTHGAPKPQKRFSGVLNSVNWKMFFHFIGSMGAVLLLISYYAWLLGAPEKSTWILSAIVALVLVICYGVFPSFRISARYFFWGLTFGAGKASLKLLVYYIFFIYEFTHLCVQIDATLATLWPPGDESNKEYKKYSVHHLRMEALLKFFHWWMWIPLMINMFVSYWESTTLMEKLRDRFDITGCEPPKSKIFHPILKRVLDITLNGFQGFFAPFVGACYYCCFLANGLIEAELSVQFKLKAVQELRDIGHGFSFSIYIFITVLFALLSYVEPFLRELQFTTMLNFFEETHVSKCEWADPEYKEKFFGRIKAENIPVPPKPHDERLENFIGQMHAKVLQVPNSRTAKKSVAFTPLSAQNNVAGSSNAARLTINQPKLMAHFQNTQRRDLF